jgi:hypothetical protein
MKDNEQNGQLEDWEFAYRQRASSSPQMVSLDYAVALTVTLFKFRDLMKELPEEFRDEFAEVDDDYNDLVNEASKSFYKLGWHDALKHQQDTPEGDR